MLGRHEQAGVQRSVKKCCRKGAWLVDVCCLLCHLGSGRRRGLTHVYTYVWRKLNNVSGKQHESALPRRRPTPTPIPPILRID